MAIAVALYNYENTWGDDSGNALDITNNGAVFDTVNKKLGVASAKYDGLDDYGNIGDKSEFENDDFTIDTWCRRVSIGSYHTLVGLQLQAAGAPNGPSGVLLRFNSDNTLTLIIVIADVFEVFTTAATYTDTTGFHQIIAKKSGTSVEIKVDNVSVKTGNTTSGTIDFSTVTSKRTSIGATWIGATSSFALPFDGQIDATYIYNGATTDAEDTTSWNGGAGLALPEIASGDTSLVAFSIYDKQYNAFNELSGKNTIV